MYRSEEHDHVAVIVSTRIQTSKTVVMYGEVLTVKSAARAQWEIGRWQCLNYSHFIVHS